MNILEMLDELEEVVNMGTQVPLVRKVMIDPAEVLELLTDIRKELPDEIQDAQYIRDNRKKILDDAKAEYDRIIAEAEAKALAMIEEDEITLKAKAKADEILRYASENSAMMKSSSLDYTDQMLYNLQEKVDLIYNDYFTKMYNDLQDTFTKINDNIAENRQQVKDQIYLSQKENADNGLLPRP